MHNSYKELGLFYCFSFAFAETVSQEEVAKAVKAMDSQEINGRRLRVRSAADKDKKGSSNQASGAAGTSSSAAPTKKARTYFCTLSYHHE